MVCLLLYYTCRTLLQAISSCTLIVKLGPNVFRPERTLKHHFEASLCDNSNITMKLTLFNAKVLKPFICSLSFKLHTHCEETTAAFCDLFNQHFQS